MTNIIQFPTEWLQPADKLEQDWFTFERLLFELEQDLMKSISATEKAIDRIDQIIKE